MSPELAHLVGLGVDLVPDGELIAGAGRPADDFYQVGSVASTRRDRPQFSFLGFDVRWLDGRPVDHLPHADRRVLLERLDRLADGTLDIVSSNPATDLDDLLTECEQLDLEGVVLKRSASRYKPGRSPDWRTIKTTAWRTSRLPARQASMEATARRGWRRLRGLTSPTVSELYRTSFPGRA